MDGTGFQEVDLKGIELAVGLAFLAMLNQHGGRINGKTIKMGFIQHRFTELKGKIPNATMFIDTFEDVLTGNAGNPEIGYQKCCPSTFIEA